jgi:hypothetical protein
MFRHENSIGIDHDDELMTMNFEQSHRKIVQHVFIQNLKHILYVSTYLFDV